MSVYLFLVYVYKAYTLQEYIWIVVQVYKTCAGICVNVYIHLIYTGMYENMCS